MCQRRLVCTLPLLLTVAGLIALCGTPALFAEESDAWPRVVVAHYSEDGAPEGLERVLTRVVEIELRRAQLLSLPRRTSDESEAAVPADEFLVERGEDLEAELVLVGTYSLTERSLSLQYRVIDVQAGELLAQAQRRGEVDLVVDRLVTDLLQELLAELGERIAQLREIREDAVRARAPDPSPEVSEEPELAEQIPAAEPPEQHEPPELPEQPEPPEPRLRRLELSVRANAIVSVGEFAPYLPYGYTAASTLLVWLGEGDFRVGLGGSAGYQRMIPAEEGLAGFVRSFIPVGIDLEFSAFDPNFISPRLALRGGAAIRIDDGSMASGLLAAAIPYASGGFGVNLALTERFGVGVEAGMRSLFHIFREDLESDPEVEPVVGFSLGLGVSSRF